jgi:hypothetical protein
MPKLETLSMFFTTKKKKEKLKNRGQSQICRIKWCGSGTLIATAMMHPKNHGVEDLCFRLFSVDKFLRAIPVLVLR